ncbi:PLDc N-terminal domain-containing protein [Cellulomonas sp. URHE0023]|uniref:PLDc N-terminal domain-containing protein n=1 Tax=Cellulomonas sp. URHE0023 TaxID=1380354 RepID=UPI00047FBD3B|nr:PLDc N-terminal domain-containing protein [Cellulomonas sp. URHE0023]
MRNLVVLALLGLTIYCLFDILRSTRDERLGVHPVLWILLVLVVPVLGALVWLGVRWSRRTAYAEISDTPPTSRPERLRSPAPDDDPEFLRRLDEERRRNDGPPAVG